MLICLFMKTRLMEELPRIQNGCYAFAYVHKAQDSMKQTYVGPLENQEHCQWGRVSFGDTDCVCFDEVWSG